MDTSDDARQNWLRLWFYIFQAGLLAAFLFNEVLPRWYVYERLGRGGIRPSAMFWNHLAYRIYHLNGPKPHLIYALIYWISFAGLIPICFCLRRYEPTLARFGWITAIVSCIYILLAPKF
ncbi:MAG: hypothetical protein ABSF38_14470 [Verrucomicrobiota bacterium]|jgi:hypothetical protein